MYSTSYSVLLYVQFPLSRTNLRPMIRVPTSYHPDSGRHSIAPFNMRKWMNKNRSNELRVTFSKTSDRIVHPRQRNQTFHGSGGASCIHPSSREDTSWQIPTYYNDRQRHGTGSWESSLLQVPVLHADTRSPTVSSNVDRSISAPSQ